jgi:hypothetical protein
MPRAYPATRATPGVHPEIPDPSMDGRLTVTNTQVEKMNSAGKDDQHGDQGVAVTLP